MPPRLPTPLSRLALRPRSTPPPLRTSSSPFRRSNATPLPTRAVRPFASSPIRPAFQPAPTGTSHIAFQEMTQSEYDQVSETDMETLHESLEELCEGSDGSWEVEYSSGVLNLLTPSGTYILNKQPPTQQIWMSSPISGPARFGRAPDGVWVHHRREGIKLGALLEGEIRELLKASGGDEEWNGVGLR